jgi:hypothetical protein
MTPEMQKAIAMTPEAVNILRQNTKGILGGG